MTEQKKYNDPFMVVTDNSTASEVAAVRLHLAERFGISDGTYVRVGRRDFGVLGKIVGFTQAAPR